MTTRPKRNASQSKMDQKDQAELCKNDSVTEAQSRPSVMPRPNLSETQLEGNMPPAWVSKFRVDLTNDIEAKINTRFDALDAKLETRFNDLEQDIKVLNSNQSDTRRRLDETSTLAQATSNKVIKLEEAILAKNGEIKSLQSQIEDLRNRNMRKTLIFYGFPEPSKNESWEDCRKMLTSHLDKCGVKNTVIDRAHRANRGSNSSEASSSPRVIFAEFLKWQDANRVLSNSKKISDHKFHSTSTNTKHSIKVDQLFSKNTADERKKLLKIRKFFMMNDSSLKIKLNYPHTLLINEGSGYKKYGFKEEDLMDANSYFDSLNK